MKRSPIALGVNIDHSATVRQARYLQGRTCGGIVEPDPIALALCAEKAGADAITLHLREDRRHIQEADVERAKEMLQVPLNFEMATTAFMRDFALKIQPSCVLIVPEKREELTTEGGLDLSACPDLGHAIGAFRDANISVSIFIDPCARSIALAKELGANSVELHTGVFANAHGDAEKSRSAFDDLFKGAEMAHDLGLIVHAGHGVNYTNIKKIATLPHLRELNVGHSILSRSLFTGIQEAIQSMRSLIDRYSQTC